MPKLCKRSLFLDSMPSAIEVGGAEKTTPGKTWKQRCVLPTQLAHVAERHRRARMLALVVRHLQVDERACKLEPTLISTRPWSFRRPHILQHRRRSHDVAKASPRTVRHNEDKRRNVPA